MTHIQSMLGDEAQSLLGHVCRGIPRDQIHAPGPDWIEGVVLPSDRKPCVMRSLAALFGHGRLAGTGYLSILPVDQGFVHGPARSFAKIPVGYDPHYNFELAIESGCNAYAATSNDSSRSLSFMIQYTSKATHAIVISNALNLIL